MHLHASALDFLVFLAYFVIAGFMWRLAETRWADRPIGKAMAFIH